MNDVLKQLTIQIRGQDVLFWYHVERLEPHPALEGVEGFVTTAYKPGEIPLFTDQELSHLIAQVCEKEELNPHRHRFCHLMIYQTDGRPNGCFEFDLLVTEFKQVGRPDVTFRRPLRCPDNVLTAFSEFLPANPYQIGIWHGSHDPWSAAG